MSNPTIIPNDIPTNHNVDQGDSNLNNNNTTDDSQMKMTVRIPCSARGVCLTHTIETAYFDIPLNCKHGTKFKCSHDRCRESGRIFRYCQVCHQISANRNFNNRHGHLPNSTTRRLPTTVTTTTFPVEIINSSADAANGTTRCTKRRKLQYAAYVSLDGDSSCNRTIADEDINDDDDDDDKEEVSSSREDDASTSTPCMGQGQRCQQSTGVNDSGAKVTGSSTPRSPTEVWAFPCPSSTPNNNDGEETTNAYDLPNDQCDGQVESIRSPSSYLASLFFDGLDDGDLLVNNNSTDSMGLNFQPSITKDTDLSIIPTTCIPFLCDPKTAPGPLTSIMVSETPTTTLLEEIDSSPRHSAEESIGDNIPDTLLLLQNKKRTLEEEDILSDDQGELQDDLEWFEARGFELFDETVIDQLGLSNLLF